MDANYGERATLASVLGREVVPGDAMLEAQARATSTFGWRISRRERILAEREGFEPSRGSTPLLAFQASAIDHSATSPGALLAVGARAAISSGVVSAVARTASTMEGRRARLKWGR